MDLEKLLVETDIVRTSRGTRNMTITLTNDSKLIWNEMKKILKKRYPDLRPSMSLFFESMLRRCEIILKKEEKSKKLREKLKNKKK